MGRAGRARRERQSRLSLFGLRRPAGFASSPACDTGTTAARVQGLASGLSGFRRAALAALLGLAAFAAAPQDAAAAPCPGDLAPVKAFWSACMTVGFDGQISGSGLVKGYSVQRRGMIVGGLSDTTVSTPGGTFIIRALNHTAVINPFITTTELSLELSQHPALPSTAAGWVLQVGSATYALDSASPYATFTFKVNDGGGDSADTYTMTINVDPVPDVTDISVTSTPTSGTSPKRYGAGETIRFTVTYDEAVTVAGDPVLEFLMADENERQVTKDAAYVSGSGTAELVFGYTVQSTDSDDNGIKFKRNPIHLDPDDSIRDCDDNNADNDYAVTGTQGDHQVDGTVGTTEAAAPSAGVLTGFTLVDVSDQSTVAALVDGAEVDLGARFAGSFGIRAEVAPNALVGSVVLSLSGAKTVSRRENIAPYSLWGDVNRGAGSALHGEALPAGSYTLTATAHAKRRAEGAVRGTLSVSFDILAPPALSVADASAEEGTDATLDFAVTLDREAAHTVTVAYATSDVSATAGDDYTATSGTLSFAAGEVEKTVSVPVLVDDVDEGSETLTLTLSSPSGAVIADGEATGTITNDGPIPQAWLARFGRTVTGQVLDAVEARLAAPREAGARMSLAGQALPSLQGGDGAAANDNAASEASLLAETAGLAGADDGRGPSGLGAHGGDGAGLETRALTQRDLIVGTSFALTGGSAEGGGFASLWGHASVAGFDGREGSLTVDGEVTTGLIGADWASAHWTAGLALGHSTGTGGWRRGGGCDLNCGGAIEATLSGVYPYAGLNLTERLSVWAAAGHGSGEVTVTPEAPEGGSGTGMTADLTMSMGAAGMRSEVLRPEDGNGLALALKGDARFARTSSEAVRSEEGNLAAADADVWLVRAGIEGSRRFALGPQDEGASVTPSFELGVRRDGGDAETGMGADLGGGLAFADAANGLTFDSRARALVAHEAEGFREWGAALSFGWDPSPETGRGLSLTLTQSWGASASGGMEALLSHETLAGLAPADGGDGANGFEASRRLEGEIGYGLPVLGGGFTGTPNVGFGLSDGGARDWRIGWRLAPAGAGGFEMNLDATRSEPANDADPPVHGVMLRGAMRW